VYERQFVVSGSTLSSEKADRAVIAVQVNNLLHQKISQLETDASLEEEEDKAICESRHPRYRGQWLMLEQLAPFERPIRNSTN